MSDWRSRAKPVVTKTAAAADGGWRSRAVPLGGGDEPIGDAPLEDESALMKVVNLVAKPAGKALETVSAPLAALDKVTGAPIRAGIGALQDGRNPFPAAADQLVAGLPTAYSQGELLPTTPELSDVAFEGMTRNGIQPEYAAAMAPPMGAVGGVVLDPTLYIPGKMATKGVELVGDAARGIGKQLAKGASAVEGGIVKGIAHTGQFMSGGALKADKAMRMYKELNSLEMLVPGSKDWGFHAAQGKRLGEMREMLQSAKIEVPGSHDVALNMLSEIQAAQGRTISNPNSQALVDFIKERAFTKKSDFATEMVDGVPVTRPVETLEARDLTLDELDDIVRNLDTLSFNPSGNPKVMKAIYGPAIRKSRQMADEILQTVPEGKLFKDEKTRFEALATAGTQRGKLLESMSNAATVGVAALTTLDPVTLLMTRSIVPSTYVKALGVVRMPRDIAGALAKAQASGSVTMMREALKQAAEKYPMATERLIRGTVLMTGKMEGNQTLDEGEVEMLAVPKSFDPEVIAQERQRIQNDSSVPSTQKAKLLSDINKNGYVNLPAPEMAMEEPSVQDQVFGGQAGLGDLLKSLEAVQ